MRNDVASAVTLIVAVGALSICTGCVEHESIQFSRDSSSTVRLLDAHTGQSIPNAEIKLRPDARYGCQSSPCAADGTVWTGRSDGEGRIVIPKDAAQTMALAESPGYAPDLLDNATHTKSGEWNLELLARDSAGESSHPLKLIDVSSKRPMANTGVIIEFSDPQGASHELALTSNVLGYVFVPDQIAAIGKHIWLKIHGYGFQSINFAESHHNIYLNPRNSTRGGYY